MLQVALLREIEDVLAVEVQPVDQQHFLPQVVPQRNQTADANCGSPPLRKVNFCEDYMQAEVHFWTLRSRAKVGSLNRA